MPEVARKGKYRLCVYGKEHPKPHAHVILDGERCVRVYLLPPAFMDAPPPGERRAILRFVKDHLEEALAKWEELNEND